MSSLAARAVHSRTQGICILLSTGLISGHHYFDTVRELLRPPNQTYPDETKGAGSLGLPRAPIYPSSRLLGHVTAGYLEPRIQSKLFR